MDPQVGTFTLIWAGLQDVFINATGSVLFGNFFAALSAVGVVIAGFWLVKKTWNLIMSGIANSKAKSAEAEKAAAAAIYAQQQLQSQQLQNANAMAAAAALAKQQSAAQQMTL